jgi:hypothetical protein
LSVIDHIVIIIIAVDNLNRFAAAIYIHRAKFFYIDRQQRGWKRREYQQFVGGAGDMTWIRSLSLSLQLPLLCRFYYLRLDRNKNC